MADQFTATVTNRLTGKVLVERHFDTHTEAHRFGARSVNARGVDASGFHLAILTVV